jgi:hypothetical protein
MELYQHSTESLQQELERREDVAEGKPRREALAKALRAASFAVEHPPMGTIGDHQMDKACRLAYELVYQCLPGGTPGGTDQAGKYEPPSGMDAGWLHVFGLRPPRARKFTTKVGEAERGHVLSLLTKGQHRDGIV